MHQISAMELAHEILQMWNRGEWVVLENADGIPIFNMTDLELSKLQFKSDEQYKSTYYYRINDSGVPETTPYYVLRHQSPNSVPFL